MECQLLTQVASYLKQGKVSKQTPKFESMESKLEQFSVLKLPVHLSGNYNEWLLTRLQEQSSTHVVTLNAEMAMLSETNQSLAEVIGKADLVIPDGSGVVLYLLLRGKKQKRCPGIELAASILEDLGQQPSSIPICFYGAKPGIAAKAAQIWQAKLPNLAIITNHGYLSPAEEEVWCQTIAQTQPQLILVGLGVPRQEFWIAAHRHLSPQAIWMGIGGSFDIWAGEKIRAPLWLRKMHLEWLYRLYQEPWRWRRMLALPKFFWRALWLRS